MSPLVLYLLLLKATVASFTGLSSLPAVRNDLVVERHVLTDAELNKAVAVARISPGPFGLYLVAVGYYAAGWPGAVAGWAAMITPAFFIVLLLRTVAPYAQDPRVHTAIEFLSWAAAGLVLASTLPMARAALSSPATIAVAAVTAAILIFTRLDTVWTILLGAAAGAGAFALERTW